MSNQTDSPVDRPQKPKSRKKVPQSSDGIPYCLLEPSPVEHELRCTRSMHSVQHGLASWDTTPLGPWSEEEPWRDGVMIGDVAFVTLNLGGPELLPLFNVFHDRKGRRGQTLPDNFEPIKRPFEEWEICRTPDYFPKGTVITSEGIQTLEASTDDQKYSFSCPANEGSIMILPEGASREDIVAAPELYEHISSQGVEWFQYLHDHHKHRSEVRIANGGLFLVTGIDKALKTAIVTLWRDEDEEDDGNVPIIRYDGAVESRWTRENDAGYNWRATYLIHQETKTFSSPFVRGLWIGLSPTAWQEYLPVDIKPFACLVTVEPSLRTSPTSLPSFVKSLPSMQSSDMEFNRVPFHPAFLIIPMMLAKVVPKSQWPKFIIVEDAAWMLLLEGICLA